MNAKFVLEKAKLVGTKGCVMLPAIMEEFDGDFIKKYGREGTISFIKNNISQEQIQKNAKLFTTWYCKI